MTVCRVTGVLLWSMKLFLASHTSLLSLSLLLNWVKAGVEAAVEGGCLPRHEGVVLVLVADARLLRGVWVISNRS